MSSSLRYLRVIADAEYLKINNKKGLKKIAARMYNWCIPLLKVFWNRYMFAISLRLDTLFLRLFKDYDAHIFIIIKKEYSRDWIPGKNNFVLSVLNFSVPLHRPNLQ